MALHFLNDTGAPLLKAGRKDYIQGIVDAGGRVVVGETITFKQSLIDGVTNAEMMRGCGCDMVMVNHYNMDMPMMPGLPSLPQGIEQFFSYWNEAGSPGKVPPTSLVETAFQDYFLESFGFGRTLADASRLAGVPIGMGLLPTEPDPSIPPALLANEANARRAIEHGANFISIICTPKLDTRDLAGYIRAVRAGFGDHGLVKVGKMPWGGSTFKTPSSEYFTKDQIEMIAEAGADVLIVPSPGTIQGFTIEQVKTWFDIAHQNGLLAEATVGTSQEGADPDVVRRFAIDSKMAGADLQQIGDSVYSGVTTPANIMAFAKAIKGERHTVRRMALSPLRGEGL